jgi:hypothetical protein
MRPSWLDPGFAIEPNRVLCREKYEDECHAYQADGSAHVEQAVLSAEKNHPWLPQNHPISNG